MFKIPIFQNDYSFIWDVVDVLDVQPTNLQQLCDVESLPQEVCVCIPTLYKHTSFQMGVFSLWTCQQKSHEVNICSLVSSYIMHSFHV